MVFYLWIRNSSFASILECAQMALVSYAMHNVFVIDKIPENTLNMLDFDLSVLISSIICDIDLPSFRQSTVCTIFHLDVQSCSC